MATDLGVHFWSGANGGGGGGGLPSAILAKVTAIGSGVTSVAVTFTPAFTTLPAVVCWLSSSNAGASIIGSQGANITTAGFTAELGATTPDTTYSLNWIASIQNG